MPIWEIFKICSDGGYIAGATFVNELGQEIMFDGESIKGLTEINMQSEWRYIEKAA